MLYDADLELFRDNFKTFYDEHIAPHYDQWERKGIMPRSVWSPTAKMAFYVSQKNMVVMASQRIIH